MASWIFAVWWRGENKRPVNEVLLGLIKSQDSSDSTQGVETFLAKNCGVVVASLFEFQFFISDRLGEFDVSERIDIPTQMRRDAFDRCFAGNSFECFVVGERVCGITGIRSFQPANYITENQVVVGGN